MPDWSRSEKTTTVVQYIVPADPKWGACWNQVQQALSKAVDDWKETHEGDMPSDDSIRVFPRDDYMVIEFDKPEPQFPMIPRQQPFSEEEIDERADRYTRQTAPDSVTKQDEPAILTKGGVAALIRDAYRAGVFSTQQSRGASRYNQQGKDRRTYEEPACGSNVPHDPHMYRPVGGMQINCCGVS